MIENNIVEYTISNQDIEVKVLNLGAIITEINYKGKNRVLKFSDYQSYLNNTMYLGSIVGRTAGRIKDGKFEGGSLPLNYIGKHNLHGNDLNKLFYKVKQSNQRLILTAIDYENDYPGDLDIEICYSLENSTLKQEIKCSSNKPTLINMTNHTYFNLDTKNPILDLNLKIESEEVGVLNDEMITTDLQAVANTAFDFRNSRLIADSLKQGDEQFAISGFIDHPFKLKGDVCLESKDCKMKIETNMPYVVGYFGSQIESETKHLENVPNKNYYGICLETQKCPGDTELVTTFYSQTNYQFTSK